MYTAVVMGSCLLIVPLFLFPENLSKCSQDPLGACLESLIEGCRQVTSSWQVGEASTEDVLPLQDATRRLSLSRE